MEEERKDMHETLLEMFSARQYAKLKAHLLEMEAFDIARFIEEKLDEKELLVFFRLLPKELASDVFVEIDSDTQELLIKAFTDKELKALVDDLFLDDTVDIIEEMPANAVKRILSASDASNRQLINELLEYPDDSAGSLMTPEFISLSGKMKVSEAFDKIRRQGLNKETIYTCYVTDSKKRLLGAVTVKDMLLAETESRIEDIMETNLVTTETMEDRESVAQKFSNYGFISLPVIDREGCIVGIITVDDAVDVLQEEATEDIQKMAAILPTDKPYLKQNVFEIWKLRVPWLLLLMISATFTGLIINVYEKSINEISTLLFACIPMLMDTGGNAGSQASVTVIRSLALGELEIRDVFKVLWKEIRVSLLLSVTVSAACFLKLILIDRLIFGYDYTYILSFVVSFSLCVTVVIAKLVGCLLPILAKRCKLDPAVVASPFITTIVDALSLILYCSFAIALLS